MSNEIKSEELTKSIDLLIEEIFAEKEEQIEKSIEIAKDSSTTADKALSQVPSSEDDSKREGRPKEIRKNNNEKTEGSYDSDISENAKEEDLKEIDQVSTSTQVDGKHVSPSAKAPQIAPFKKSLTEEEYNEYLELKKAQEASKQEELKKAEVLKTEELIKSVVEKTASKYESKIESLQKSLSEQQALIKAMASQPVRSKSVTNIEALEKSEYPENAQKKEFFSKYELLEAAEELVKSKELNVNHVIELENNGYIYDEFARQTLENYVKNKK